MKKEEVYKVFEKLHLPVEKLPKYTDPYSFAANIKKCTDVEVGKGQVIFSSGTSSNLENTNA